MSDELLREIHDLVAGSENPAEASLRPPGTTWRELRAMQRDVLRKLRPRRDRSVAEIGCGVGLLGVPLAERSQRYVGLDFAPRAVDIANQRLRDAGAGGRARVLCLDVQSVSDEQLHELGRFDRVLLYAVLQCVRDEREGVRFLQSALDLLSPGGVALVGSLPLDDLRVDWAPPDPPPRGLRERLLAAGRWILTPGSAPVPLTRRWKLRRAVERIVKMRIESPVGDFTPLLLPEHYTLALSTTTVEHWLSRLRGDFTYRWELPAPNVPLAAGRADLLLVKS